MSHYRRAAKVDDNQAAIVSALRQIPGVSVAVGHDDILVGYRGRTFWVEIKNPTASKKRKEGEVSQRALKEAWRGHYAIVESLDAIISELNGGD